MPAPAPPARSRLLAEPAVGQHHLQPPGHLAGARPGALQAGGDASGVHRLGEPDGLARHPPAAEPGTAQMMAPAPAGEPGDHLQAPAVHRAGRGPGPGWAGTRTSSRSASRTPCRPVPTGRRHGAGRATVRGHRRRGGGPRPRTGRSAGHTACWRPVRWPSSCRHRSGHRAARGRMPSRGTTSCSHWHRWRPGTAATRGNCRPRARRPRQPARRRLPANPPPALASGSVFAAGPPLHRPAAPGATGAVTACGGVAAIGNLNMLLSLRDSWICEAEITSCEALLQ